MSTWSAPENGGLQEFVEVSAILTGFTAAELEATGLAERYLAVLSDEIAKERLPALLQTVRGAPDPGALDDPVVRDVAYALTYLWYSGVWPALPAPTDREKRAPYVVSPRAYAEGLVWKTFHGAPPGTVAPGFGSWARAPRGTPA